MNQQLEVYELLNLDETEELSNCCGANMQGEPVNRLMHDDDIVEGRCADCKEMAVFERGE